MKTEKDIVEQAKALCQKFVDKVESGRARSVETYADCKALLGEINLWQQDKFESKEPGIISELKKEDIL
jgi:hypothetical protein